MTAGSVAATERLLDLLESGDGAGLASMLDDDVTWTIPMSSTGRPEDAVRLEGKAAFLARAARLGRITRSARFVERRITATADGTVTFVQTLGDFRTTSGAPYRNTYVFRFDWREGHLLSWEEYANPVAVHQAFPSTHHEPEQPPRRRA